MKRYTFVHQYYVLNLMYLTNLCFLNQFYNYGNVLLHTNNKQKVHVFTVFKMEPSTSGDVKAGQTKQKTVSKNTVLNTWSEEIKDNFEFVFNTTTNKVKHVTCKVCRKHCHRIEILYRGKIVQDVKTYGQNGTSYIFKPNLERHMSSAGHIKCLEIETGEPVCKKQKTLSSAFGSARERSLKALQSAMRCSRIL